MLKKKRPFYRAHILCSLVLMLSSNVFAKDITLKMLGVSYNAQFFQSSTDKADSILLVHNALENSDSTFISSISTLLNEQGYNVLAINLSLRINNRKATPNICKFKQSHKFEDAIAEIKLWLKWLSAKIDTQKIWLLGHGLGANQVALYLSQSKDKQIKGGILISPLSQSTLIKGYADNQGLEKYISYANTHSDYVFPNMKFFGCSSSRITSTSLLSYYQVNPLFNITYLANEIGQPMLVISGENDPHHTEIAEKIDIFHRSSKKLNFKLIKGATADFEQLYIMDLLPPLTKFMK